ncbi:MAG: hypothetical protein ACK56I_03820, partial [bacterium]
MKPPNVVERDRAEVLGIFEVQSIRMRVAVQRSAQRAVEQRGVRGGGALDVLAQHDATLRFERGLVEV